ncbi:MAG TPA: hypothetical protein VM370_12910 [Candidatus Thermoplasmatota archaeon]|nr:hypothetical protein [Candidatus Thermoplasmatota archaeon]
MGFARLTLYIIGLIVVVMAAWIFLTQTPIAKTIPAGVALAIILLLVGIGVMAGARAMDDTYTTRRRVTHDADYVHGPVAPGTTAYVPPATSYQPPATVYTPPTQAGGETTTIEERRF